MGSYQHRAVEQLPRYPVRQVSESICKLCGCHRSKDCHFCCDIPQTVAAIRAMVLDIYDN